jgi:hypothetical protein
MHKMMLQPNRLMYPSMVLGKTMLRARRRLQHRTMRLLLRRPRTPPMQHLLAMTRF